MGLSKDRILWEIYWRLFFSRMYSFVSIILEINLMHSTCWSTLPKICSYLTFLLSFSFMTQFFKTKHSYKCFWLSTKTQQSSQNKFSPYFFLKFCFHSYILVLNLISNLAPLGFKQLSLKLCCGSKVQNSMSSNFECFSLNLFKYCIVWLFASLLINFLNLFLDISLNLHQ